MAKPWIRSPGVATLGALGWLAACAEVTPPAERRLVFAVQPSDAFVLDPITPPVRVAIQVGSSTVTTATDNVTLALGANPGAGTLSGNLFVGASNGIATFDPLHIDRPGIGYTLTANALGSPARRVPRLPSASSPRFW